MNTSSCTACRRTASAPAMVSSSRHQSQLVVETEGRNQDDHLDASSLLESSESVVTETQEPMTDGFTDKWCIWDNAWERCADCFSSQHQQHTDRSDLGEPGRLRLSRTFIVVSEWKEQQQRAAVEPGRGLL
ncbi:hypothetical protein INR49_010402 [Caranx melampygus]|nr:hypothetical protein INR49_010402 [Caranx melampygus]